MINNHLKRHFAFQVLAEGWRRLMINNHLKHYLARMGAQFVEEG